MMGGGTGAYALHWSSGAARCVRSHIPGALSILKGAVPGRARGLGHMAPTYFRREPGIDASTAEAAPHFNPRSDHHPRKRTIRSPPIFRCEHCGRPRAATGIDMTTPASPDAVKATYRHAALARRDALPAADRARAAEIIAARGLPVAIAPGVVVSGFS